MNTTALAVIQPDELEVIQRAARMLAVSNYFDGKGDNPQAIAMIATKILAGREMGFGPFASANGIHIIQGRPSVGANLMASAVKSSGRYNYRVKEMTADKCAIEFLEREGDKWVSLGISEFTRADAVAANTKNLTTFPRNMFFARAMSNGVRWYCPDVFSGNAVYVPEELGAEVDGEGNVVSTTYIVTKPEPERQVDTSTGEIVDSLPVATDVIFDAEEPPTHPVASQSQQNRMHALGNEYYRTPEVWERNRPKWVRDASGGAVDSSKKLTPEQVDWVITCLESRIAKRAQQDAQQPIATVA